MAEKEPDFSDMKDYIDKVSVRLSEIEALARTISKEIYERKNKMKRSSAEIKVDIKTLKDRLEKISRKLETEKREIKILIAKFKDISKKEQFNRLQEKIDAWAPEKRLTRNELVRNL